MVSSVSTAPATGSAASGLASVAVSGPFLTEELALLTPDTVLDSEAKIWREIQIYEHFFALNQNKIVLSVLSSPNAALSLGKNNIF